MGIQKEIEARSNNQCEVCGATENLTIYHVPPTSTNITLDNSIYGCSICIPQIEGAADMDINHWRCLNDAMWSEVDAVKVISWRMLTRLRAEGWPQDLLDMMYLEEDTLKWAQATNEGNDEEKVVHKDCNGVVLNAGDSVVLIKDLNVKGSSLVAKRGAHVRNISLDHDNAEYIEGKVDGQQIVILTKFVKKS